MIYKCKLKIENGLYDSLPSFEVILKYKAEDDMFYKRISLFSYGCYTCNEEDILETLKFINNKEDFMGFVKDKIIVAEDENLKNKNTKDEITKEYLKAKNIKFEIKI